MLPLERAGKLGRQGEDAIMRKAYRKATLRKVGPLKDITRLRASD